MNRKQCIDHIRYAGYHNDEGSFMRLFVENRISFESAREAFRNGIKAKENGMKCNCVECKEDI